MNPQYLSQPLEFFRAGFANKKVNAIVQTAPGCRMDKWFPLLSEGTWKVSPESNDLLTVDFISAVGCTGPVFERQLRKSSNVDPFDSRPAFSRDSGKPYSLRRLISTFIPETSSGSHSFGVYSVGNAKLFTNGAIVLDNTDWQSPREAFYAFESPENPHQHAHASRRTVHDHSRILIQVLKWRQSRWLKRNPRLVPAEEVAQVYVMPSMQQRLISLAAFERTTLMQPGDEQAIEVEFRRRNTAQ
jgi:hypothetical protein